MARSRIPFWIKVMASVLAIELLGGLGGLVTSQSISGWYTQLEKPAGTPPNWVFAPVWISLYAMIGVSFAIAWQRGFRERWARFGLILFVVQMALNLAWTPLFFGLHNLIAALAVIVLLWVAIVATAVAFSTQSRVAGYLLIPYLIWVTYATYLNVGYWILNR